MTTHDLMQADIMIRNLQNVMAGLEAELAKVRAELDSAQEELASQDLTLRTYRCTLAEITRQRDYYQGRCARLTENDA